MNIPHSSLFTTHSSSVNRLANLVFSVAYTFGDLTFLSMFDATITPTAINQMNHGNMLEHLSIEFTEVTERSLTARMPVDHRTRQPMGLLHGGASVALAESLGSVASYLLVDTKKYACVGLEINANHIKGAREGYVYGKVTPLHVGKRTHVWEIRVTNEQEQLVCVSRLTVAVIEQ